MFYSVNSYSGAGQRKGLSGLVSGMDTDQMVEALTGTTRGKIAKQLEKKQSTLWKQESYREVTGKIADFQKKYLTYSSGSSNITSPNFFKTGTITNNSPFVKVSGNVDSARNVVIKDILELAETARFSSSKKFSSQKITSGKIEADWKGSAVNGLSIRVQVGSDKKETYDITVGNDFAFPQNADGSDPTPDQMVRSLVDELNKGVNANKELKGKLEFNMAGDGKIRLFSPDGTTELSIVKDAQNPNLQEALVKGLGLDPAGPATEIIGNAPDATKLFEDKVLCDELEGTSITINYNGVDKVITFDAADNVPGHQRYVNPSEMVTYMQEKIDKAFGPGRIAATYDWDSSSFDLKTVGNGADNATLSIKDSSKKGVLGQNSGALHLGAGISNRVAWNMSIKDLGNQLGTPLTKNADGKFELTINDVKIELGEDETLSDMVAKINNSAAGVKVAYSTISDTFSVVALESGLNGKINVERSDPNGSNLADVLFGTTADRETTVGRDASIEVSFDGGRTSSFVTRNSNSFSLDGLNVDLLSKSNNEGLDMTGQSLEISVGGNTYTLGVSADFKLDEKLSTKDKAVALMNELNKGIANDPALNGKIKFGMQNGIVALQSVDGTTKVGVSGGSTQGMLDALGFPAAVTPVREELVVVSSGNYKLEKDAKEDISFAVENNTDELVKKLMTFIDDYNQIIKLADTKIYEKQDRNYAPLTDEQKKEMSEDEVKVWEAKAKEGILANDPYLNTAILEMRESMSNPVFGMETSMALSKMGIQTADYLDNGQLTVNEAALRKVIAEDPEAITKLFTQSFGDPTNKDDVAKSGIATRLNYTLTNLGGSDGLLVQVAGKKNDTIASQDRLSTEVRRIDAELKKLKATLKSEEERYFAQFSYMENYLNQMNAQSSWLTQQTSG